VQLPRPSKTQGVPPKLDSNAIGFGGLRSLAFVVIVNEWSRER
jgi:hypothetical protein